MRKVHLFLAFAFMILLIATLTWLAQMPDRTPITTSQPTTLTQVTLRLGRIPEGDIYQQDKAYHALAEYLGKELDCHVQVVTSSTYSGVLDDFREAQVDFAFLGSLVTVLAVDRYDAHVLLKPEYVGGMSSYCGVIFVSDNSPIHSLADLRGHTVGGVRTTTAGALFPVYRIGIDGLLGAAAAPKMVWSGTHDDVISEVFAGSVDAGATKNLRLNAYLQQHPDAKIRELARSAEVPENALVVRQGLPAVLENRLRTVLLAMNGDPDGRTVLAMRHVTRFVACGIQEYSGLYDMLEAIQPGWPDVGINGPPPRRPARAPSTRTTQPAGGT